MTIEIEGQTLYTEQEVTDKINAVIKNMDEANARSLTWKERHLNQKFAEDTLSVIRDLVGDGTLDEEDALKTYNAIADRMGWDMRDSLTRTYTVCVNYKGYTVAEFTDIQADDESEACNEVESNMDYEASINITVNYNGDSGSTDIDLDSWEIDSSDFEFEASEQS